MPNKSGSFEEYPPKVRRMLVRSQILRKEGDAFSIYDIADREALNVNTSLVRPIFTTLLGRGEIKVSGQINNGFEKVTLYKTTEKFKVK